MSLWGDPKTGLPGLSGFLRAKLEAETYIGVRLRRAQLRSRFVQFPSAVEITYARDKMRLEALDNATSALYRVAKLPSFVL